MRPDTLPVKIELPASFFAEEVRCSYTVTPGTKRLWAVLLDLLCEFDRVCRRHGIRYWLDSGTLLGAVRHRGFIPWDDDIDVIMPRSEYDRLNRLAPGAFEPPYFWQTNGTDPGSARRHAQLRNSRTTMILTDEMREGVPAYRFNQGVFMDIFVLDEIPQRASELTLFRRELGDQAGVIWQLKEWLPACTGSPELLQTLDRECRLFDRLVTRYNGRGNRRIANFALNPHRKASTLFDRELFAGTVEAEFEGMFFPVPLHSDQILTGFYGNWKQLVVKPGLHGGVFLDTERPYTAYLPATAPEQPERAGATAWETGFRPQYIALKNRIFHEQLAAAARTKGRRAVRWFDRLYGMYRRERDILRPEKRRIPKIFDRPRPLALLLFLLSRKRLKKLRPSA